MDSDDFLILRTGEAEGLVTPSEALDAIEEAWRDYGQSRDVLSHPSVLEMATPAASFRVKGAVSIDGGLAGFRLLSQGEASRDWFWLADLQGRPLALIEAAWLRSLRTASTAALAAKLLAAPGAASVALIGAGRIAAHLPAALAVALPGVGSLHVVARRPEAVAEFCAAQPADQPLKVIAAESPEAAVAAADIVITLSSATAPVVPVSALRPGATVIGLGRADLPAGVLTDWAGRFVVDSADVNHPDGNIAAWIASGAVTAEVLGGQVSTDLGLVAAGLAPGRLAADQNVLAIVQGMAIGDLALAAIAWRKGRLRRLGLRFALGETAPPRGRQPTPRRNRSLR